LAVYRDSTRRFVGRLAGVEMRSVQRSGVDDDAFRRGGGTSKP
jgi:hypothetical protein